MTDTLLPCPFCGCSGTLCNSSIEGQTVICSGCLARVCDSGNFKIAADRWNTRTPSITRANERDLDINAIKQETHDWFDMCDCGNVDRCEVIDALHEFGYLKHTPQPSPQSDMVAVFTDLVKEVMHESDNIHRYMALPHRLSESGWFKRAEQALSMLQPYTKGE